MSDRIVSADEARALLDGTTSGPWTYDPPNEQCPAWITQAHDPTEDVALIEDVLDVDGRLMASAPDLARSVEALHASESAAVARASRLALDLHAAQSEGAEARRDVRLRDETIEELRRTVREVSRACETLRERCERAENTHDAAAQAFDDLVARLWCAAIETTLRRRDPEATLWRYPTETDRALWVARPLRMEVTARGYGANADLDALRDLAILAASASPTAPRAVAVGVASTPARSRTAATSASALASW